MRGFVVVPGDMTMIVVVFATIAMSVPLMIVSVMGNVADIRDAFDRDAEFARHSGIAFKRTEERRLRRDKSRV